MQQQYWRILDYSSKHPALNLAIEEAILRCLLEYNGFNTLRLWQNSPSVVIGYFQNPSSIDVAACKKLGIDILRRVSGGGAVYHDYGNLNYSVIIHKSSLKESVEDVEKSYDLFCSGIIEGLKLLGVNAYNNGGDILVRGKKVSGSAQFRLYDVILHHGTLMVNVNLKTLERVLGVSAGKNLINLQDALPNKVSLNKVKNAVKAGFEKIFNVKFVKGTLSNIEKQEAKKLWKIKYSKEQWNIKNT
jgi:lipoate-protein ligase A